jgi:hypothetical protein
MVLWNSHKQPSTYIRSLLNDFSGGHGNHMFEKHYEQTTARDTRKIEAIRKLAQ